MFGEFPLGPQWAAQLLAAVLPPSKVGNVFVGHRDSVAAQLVRACFGRSGNLGDIIARVGVAYALLDKAFDEDPERVALIVDQTFQRLGELQERESSFEQATRVASKDDLERKYGSYLDLYEFTHEQYFRTLAAPYVAADAITRTREDVPPLIDTDGRVTPSRVSALETGRGMKVGTLSDGQDSHLRNSAAHHRYSVIDDDMIRLWDMNQAGKRTWGPVEWKFWDLRTNVYRLSNSCSVLILALAVFDISHGRTIKARGWGIQERPRPKRRDIAKSELLGMAAVHGFGVEEVKVAGDGALVIALRVKGDTMIEQTTQIMAGGGQRGQHFEQKVRTLWGPLRDQVYGFLQTTLDVHGGFDLVRVAVAGKDGKTSLGDVEVPFEERLAMTHKHEPIEAIRARLPQDTLADETIPVVVKGPVVPAGLGALLDDE